MTVLTDRPTDLPWNVILTANRYANRMTAMARLQNAIRRTTSGRRHQHGGQHQQRYPSTLPQTAATLALVLFGLRHDTQWYLEL